jgi:small subunit ribosomal protein S8
MTDPIADMLTRIRNANSAMFDTVKMPGSKLKVSLAGILEREGFIAGYHVEANSDKPGTTLEISLKYSADRTRTIAGIKRISKPGLRIYARADGIPPVLSTSQGLVTDREARRKHLGGEVLCHVW